MPKTPNGTSQRDHSGIAFRELIEACHEPAVLFQPAKPARNDIALSVLGPIKKPSSTPHSSCAIISGVLFASDQQT